MDRVNGFLKSTDVFFVKSAGANAPPKTPQPSGDIMAEVACESPEPQTCNHDQPSFQAYLSRWLAVTTQLVPTTAATIFPRLQASATAAAAQCAGQNKNLCGRRWYQTGYDGQFGVGEQMSAMSIFQNNLIGKAEAPLTLTRGGTSKSDPNAGAGNGNLPIDPNLLNAPTTGDKAGAGILTFLSLVLVIGGTSWIVI